MRRGDFGDLYVQVAAAKGKNKLQKDYLLQFQKVLMMAQE